MKDKTLHMIGNAHIDPVWQWRWQEGLQEVKATFRSALDRMDEYDNFIFVSSSAAFYEWVEENDPDMFDEIRTRVQEGRWGIVGGWWIQPDCNIPGGESFVRQGLYGQRYFKDRFGVIARTGYNVDSFGHCGSLPQILLKSGMDSYVFMRPDTDDMALPSPLFRWGSIDGSSVHAFRIIGLYCSKADDVEDNVRKCIDEYTEKLNHLMCFYGVGNHGGGPTKKQIEHILKLNDNPDLPQLVFSTPDRFFNEIRDREQSLPAVNGELQHHAVGCYSAHSGIKRWNRLAENELLKAEKFSLISNWLTRHPYPDDFSHAWKDVLFNQFHDILAGTSLEQAYEDAHYLCGEAMSIAGRNLNSAIQSISWNIRIEPQKDMKPIVVFNPHAWAVKANIELEMRYWTEPYTLLDDEDNPVPMQTVQSHAADYSRYRLSFNADLPPMGYRTYRFMPQSGEVRESLPLKSTSSSMENDLFRLELDGETGYIKSLFDKRRKVEVFSNSAAKPVVMDDPSDTWGHDFQRYDKEEGAFSADSVRLMENGPVKSVLRVISRYGDSRIIQDFTMYSGMRQIDVHVTIDWRERFKLLKLQFPVNIDSESTTCEIPYGFVDRPATGNEEPCQSWIDVSGVVRGTEIPYGISLLNDGKYSYDIADKAMSLTLLRSPVYSHHDPTELLAEKDYPHLDQGIQHFTYSILPHEDDWIHARTPRYAAELNQRPIAILETYHPRAALPQKYSFLSADESNIIVSVIKKAEDSDDMIIRCYETSGMTTRASITLPKWDRVITADFGPCEIKTFLVPQNYKLPVLETNLLEIAE